MSNIHQMNDKYQEFYIYNIFRNQQKKNMMKSQTAPQADALKTFRNLQIQQFLDLAFAQQFIDSKKIVKVIDHMVETHIIKYQHKQKTLYNAQLLYEAAIITYDELTLNFQNVQNIMSKHDFMNNLNYLIHNFNSNGETIFKNTSDSMIKIIKELSQENKLLKMKKTTNIEEKCSMCQRFIKHESLKETKNQILNIHLNDPYDFYEKKAWYNQKQSSNGQPNNTNQLFENAYMDMELTKDKIQFKLEELDQYQHHKQENIRDVINELKILEEKMQQSCGNFSNGSTNINSAIGQHNFISNLQQIVHDLILKLYTKSKNILKDMTPETIDQSTQTNEENKELELLAQLKKIKEHLNQVIYQREKASLKWHQEINSKNQDIKSLTARQRKAQSIIEEIKLEKQLLFEENRELTDNIEKLTISYSTTKFIANKHKNDAIKQNKQLKRESLPKVSIKELENQCLYEKTEKPQILEVQSEVIIDESLKKDKSMKSIRTISKISLVNSNLLKFKASNASFVSKESPFGLHVPIGIQSNHKKSTSSIISKDNQKISQIINNEAGIVSINGSQIDSSQINVRISSAKSNQVEDIYRESLIQENQNSSQASSKKKHQTIRNQQGQLPNQIMKVVKRNDKKSNSSSFELHSIIKNRSNRRKQTYEPMDSCTDSFFKKKKEKSIKFEKLSDPEENKVTLIMDNIKEGGFFRDRDTILKELYDAEVQLLENSTSITYQQFKRLYQEIIFLKLENDLKPQITVHQVYPQRISNLMIKNMTSDSTPTEIFDKSSMKSSSSLSKQDFYQKLSTVDSFFKRQSSQKDSIFKNKQNLPEIVKKISKLNRTNDKIYTSSLSSPECTVRLSMNKTSNLNNLAFIRQKQSQQLALQLYLNLKNIQQLEGKKINQTKIKKQSIYLSNSEIKYQTQIMTLFARLNLQNHPLYQQFKEIILSPQQKFQHLKNFMSLEIGSNNSNQNQLKQALQNILYFHRKCDKKDEYCKHLKAFLNKIWVGLEGKTQKINQMM